MSHLFSNIVKGKEIFLERGRRDRVLGSDPAGGSAYVGLRRPGGLRRPLALLDVTCERAELDLL